MAIPLRLWYRCNWKCEKACMKQNSVKTLRLWNTKLAMIQHQNCSYLRAKGGMKLQIVLRNVY